MMYRVVTYGRGDDRIRGTMIIPGGLVPWVKSMAGLTPSDDGMGEYLLNENQIRRLAQYLHFKPEPEYFYYYIEPYITAEATGLQSEEPIEARAAE
jgi:hypothetical protein